MGVQINGDTGNISATKADYSGNVTIGGTLTYEDVTNIDSVGLITARNGIEVGARPGVAASISVDGNAVFSGIVTAASFSGIDLGAVTGATGDFSIADKIVHTGDTNTAIRFPAADTITAETGGSERVRIDSSGRLGIGTDSATRGLSVEGTGNASRLFVNDSTNHKAVEFGADSTGSFQSTLGDNPHLIYTNGTERARFTSDGLKFADGKGIDFSSKSGSASGSTSALFDDYEEGTWTPSFSAGETLSIYSARYVKIGRLVTANCYIYNFSDLSGNTNSFQIEGLPYTASGSNYHGGGFIGYAAAMNYGYPLLPLVAQNGTYGYFHRQDATGSAWRYVDMHNVSNGQSGQMIVTFVYETAT